MGLFKSKYEKELDAVIKKLEMNMSNNYKDAAQDNYKELIDTYKRLCDEGFKGKAKEEYGTILEEYRVKMEGFTHKDQKPYWT